MTTTAGSTGTPGPDHAAVPYDAPADLAARLAPRLAPVLAEGGPVLAVLAAPERDALRDRLGDAADGVEFADPVREHRLPPFTVAIRWARLGRRVRAGGRPAVVVGQHVELPAGPGHWARLDIALNVALAGLPVTALCPCQGAGNESHVRQTHPTILTADGPLANPAYRPPPDAVLDYPPPPPPDLGPSAVELTFGRDELVALRRVTARVGVEAGLDDDRVADLVLAVSELASNSVEHGPGTGRVLMWKRGTSVTAEVSDEGHLDLPFAGLVAPPPSGARGRGLWLACELTDVLQVWGGTGTVVRTTVGEPPDRTSQA